MCVCVCLCVCWYEMISYTSVDSLWCMYVYIPEIAYLMRIYSSVLQCVAVCCSVLWCVAVCCSVLQYAAVCYSVL